MENFLQNRGVRFILKHLFENRIGNVIILFSLVFGVMYYVFYFMFNNIYEYLIFCSFLIYVIYVVWDKYIDT